MRALGVLLSVLLALAVLQGLSRFLALLTLALLLWAVCFKPREVAATLVGLVVSSLIILNPGWFALLLGLALVAHWLQQP
jgi:hypothetical protein